MFLFLLFGIGRINRIPPELRLTLMLQGCVLGITEDYSFLLTGLIQSNKDLDNKNRRLNFVRPSAFAQPTTGFSTTSA